MTTYIFPIIDNFIHTNITTIPGLLKSGVDIIRLNEEQRKSLLRVGEVVPFGQVPYDLYKTKWPDFPKCSNLGRNAARYYRKLATAQIKRKLFRV